MCSPTLAQSTADPWKLLRGEFVAPKPHKRMDPRWRAIQALKKIGGKLGEDNFVQLKRLGKGDVGQVSLVQLKSSNLKFAMKMLDKHEMVERNKIHRVRTGFTFRSASITISSY